LFLICILEIFIFSKITLHGAYNFANNAKLLSADKENKTGYYDYSSDAIKKIKTMDNDFYRINQIRMVLFSDPLFHDYYGSSHYTTTHRHSYSNFLSRLNIETFRNYGHYIWTFGLRDRSMLMTLTAFKYIVSAVRYSPPFGYEYLDTVGNREIYINKYNLPLGFAYDSYVLDDNFLALNEISMDLTLLSAAVVNNPIYNITEHYPILLNIEEKDIHEIYIKAVNERRKESFIIDKFSQNHITGTIETKGDRILFFSIPYDRGWSLKINGEPVEIEIVNIGFIGAQIGTGFHYIELEYRAPGLLPGAIISLLSLVCFILLVIFRKKITFLNGEFSNEYLNIKL
jgi:uncharacterized membrane protein YfhO